MSIHELVLGHGQNAARTYGGKDADVAARGQARGERHAGGRPRPRSVDLVVSTASVGEEQKRKTKPGEMRRLTVET